MESRFIWSGYLTRELAGRLTDGDQTFHIKAVGKPGQLLRIVCDAPHAHWRGCITEDRTRWSLACKFGFIIGGPVRFEDEYCRLEQDEVYAPPGLQWPCDVRREAA